MSDSVSADELRSQVERDYAQFAEAVGRLGDARLAQPADGEWTVNDILAHITLWHERMATIVEGLLRGEPPTSLRQPGENAAAAVDRVNAAHYTANQQRPADAIRADLDCSYARAVAALAQLRDADLAGDSALSTLLGGSLLELIAGDTYEHYAEHLPAIQARSR